MPNGIDAGIDAMEPPGLDPAINGSGCSAKIDELAPIDNAVLSLRKHPNLGSRSAKPI